MPKHKDRKPEKRGTFASYEAAVRYAVARGMRIVETIRTKGALRLNTVDKSGRPATLRTREGGWRDDG